METPEPEITGRALDELRRQIDHARVNVSHADTKATLLAAGAIPLTALLLAAPSLDEQFGFSNAFAWAATVFMSCGVICLGTAVWPRLAGSSGIRNGAHRSPEQIIDKALSVSSSPEGRLQDAAAELSLLATLAYAKFRRIQAAMLCFAMAAMLMLVAAIE